MKHQIRQLTLYLGIGIVAMVFGLGLLVQPAKADSIATGTIASSVNYTGGLVNFGVMSWTASTSASSTITMQVRTGTTSDMLSAPAWSTCNTITNGANMTTSNCVVNGQPYVQYLATYSTDYTGTSTFVSAELDDVTLNYNAMATLISSPYDTMTSDDIIQSINWSQSVAGSSLVEFQLRTSPDNSAWTSWLGPTSASDYYTDYTGGQTINSTNGDGVSDRYVQYKVYLVSDGTNLPVLSDVTINYNSKIPLVTGVSPNLVTTGTSSMAVTISGTDFYSGATVNFTNGSRVVAATGITVVSSSTIICTVNLANEPAGYYNVTVTNTNAGVGTLNNAYHVRYSVGTFTSSVKDMGGPMTFSIISWDASTTASSTLTMQVRTGTTSDMLSAPAWSTCNTVANGANMSSSNCVVNGSRYVQYQVTYQAEYNGVNGFVSPELDDVSLGYATLQTLISSSYDTSVSDTVIQSISWSQSTPGASTAEFQLRTSPDNSTWTSWLGPTSASDYYTDHTGGQAINTTNGDGASDRYVQYKVYLLADGNNLPVVNDVTINYNAAIPIITSISPTSTTTAPTTLPLVINGSDFRSGATVVLSNDQGQSITGTVTASTSAQITGNFTTANLPGGRYTVTVTNPNGGVGTLANAFLIQQTTGIFASVVKDLGSSGLTAISWTATTTATSTVTMQVRTGTTSDMLSAPAWSTCNTIANGASMATSNCATNGQRYLQYQANFAVNYATSSVFSMPELDDVTFGTYSFASSSLISNYYDTAEIHNVINGLTWTQTAPGASYVCVQIRTSPGEAGAPTSWSDWYGATGDGACYTNPAGNSIYATQQDGYNDRWLQYKVTLAPDGINAPTATNLNISYVTSSATPTAVTSPIAWVGSTNAKGIGRIADSGTGPISIVGFDYGLTPTPTWSVSNNVYLHNDYYDLVMSNLQKNTMYYYRAWAVNARGTSTVNDWQQFTTAATTTLQTMILKTKTILKANVELR